MKSDDGNGTGLGPLYNLFVALSSRIGEPCTSHSVQLAGQDREGLRLSIGSEASRQPGEGMDQIVGVFPQIAGTGATLRSAVPILVG